MNNPAPRAAIRVPLALAALLALAGCGGPPRSQVRGKVTLDGKPVANGLIDFLPVGGKGQTGGASIMNGDYAADLGPGAYEVKITSAVVVGKQKLYDTPDSPVNELVENNVPAKYNTKSELTAEFQPGPNEKNFELTGAIPLKKAP